MKYFSTFTGIGGFEIGIHNAYRNTLGREQADSQGEQQNWQRLLTQTGKDTRAEDGRSGERGDNITDERPLCVGYSEIDKYAISVFERHYPNVRNYGDITKINAEELPDFDCLVGGFPCQAFSIAGKRHGFEDTRGTLFFDLARILRAKQPRLFVFENVKGLLSHDKGNTFRTIIDTIDELGYDCQWQVLNSKNHGVPQNRERVIIVGHLRGTPRPEAFPIGGTDSQDTRIVGQDVAYTIDANYHKGTNTLAKSRRSLVDVAYPRRKGFREYTEIAPTVRNYGSGGNKMPMVTGDELIRRLTPKECERLQAFPDDWTKYGEDEHGTRIAISDTQRYKMCGNAVTTNVIRDVFERILV